MTEEKWFVCEDPGELLAFYRGKVTHRKARLYGIACCRVTWSWMVEPQVRRAIDLSEAFSDDMSVQDELDMAVQQVTENHERVATGDTGGWALWHRLAAVLNATGNPPRAKLVPHHLAISAIESGIDNPLLGLATQFVRDIFGNPFRPVAVDAYWRSSAVTALAKSIYEEQRFDRLPILADALEDAGCENENILNHCRCDGPHVRGCWVVDLILGKT